MIQLSRSAASAALFLLSAALFPAHAATPAPRASSTTHSPTIEPHQSNAIFTIEISNDGGATQHVSGTFSASDILEVYANITPDPSVAGLNGTIFMVASVDNAYYTRDNSGQWLPWDGMPQSLAIAVDPHPLAESERVGVITNLSGLRGTFTVFLGYDVGGVFDYNTTPLTFTVE